MSASVHGMDGDMDVRLAQLDRAFGYGPKGRGFESSNARYCVRLCTLLCAFVHVTVCVCARCYMCLCMLPCAHVYVKGNSGSLL